jgi:hypothetical protein
LLEIIVIILYRFTILLPTLLEHIQHTNIKLTTYLYYYLMTFPTNVLPRYQQAQCRRYKWQHFYFLSNSPYFFNISQKSLLPGLAHLFPDFYIGFIYYWTCTPPEYSWNTASWILNNRGSLKTRYPPWCTAMLPLLIGFPLSSTSGCTVDLSHGNLTSTHYPC